MAAADESASQLGRHALLADHDDAATGDHPAAAAKEQARVLPAVAAACGAAIGATLFGYTLGYSSPALPAMQGDVFHRLSCGDDDDKADVTSAMSSLWSSIVNAGAMVGALAGGGVLERQGRRGALLYVVAPVAGAGWVWTAAARTWAELLAARVVIGAGVGLVSSAVPVYIAETAPARLRGGLASVNQLAVTLGIVAVYLAGDLLPHARRTYNCGDAAVSAIHPAGWRLLAWLAAALAGLLACVAVGLPESPTWLARRGRLADAVASLCALRGVRRVPPPKTAAAAAEAGGADDVDNAGDVNAFFDGEGSNGELADELAALRSAVPSSTRKQQTEEKEEDDEAAAITPLDLARLIFAPPGGPNAKDDSLASTREPFAIAVTLMLIQQFTGINAVIFFAGDVLGEAGVKNRDLGALIVMIVQFVATGVACLLVDRLGRRPLLLISLGVQTAASALMAAYDTFDFAPVVAIVALVVFITGFALGLGPLCWAMMPELLPRRARGAASAVVTTVNWGCAFLVTEVYASMVAAMSPAGTFLLFAAVGVVGFFYVATTVPETSGRSLDDIERYFADRAAARHRGAGEAAELHPEGSYRAPPATGGAALA